MQIQDADIYLFQEVDTKAKRSYNINEYKDRFENIFICFLVSNNITNRNVYIAHDICNNT